MYLINKDKLIRDLITLQPYNKDIPQWVWNVINGQSEIVNAVIIPNNSIASVSTKGEPNE